MSQYWCCGESESYSFFPSYGRRTRLYWGEWHGLVAIESEPVDFWRVGIKGDKANDGLAGDVGS